MVSEEKPETGSTDGNFVAEADTGARNPRGSISRKVLFYTPLAWSLFQLWYISPLPFALDFGILNDTRARSIHLAFAVFLAFTAFPALRGSPRDRIPFQDWAMALAGASAAGYLFAMYEALSSRPALPTWYDLVAALAGMLLLLEATRRTLGPPLVAVAALFLGYTFGGPYMPEVISHQGKSLSAVMSHQWLSTEGVFGVALGVSTSFVFMFVLFGALLEKAGAGGYFTRVAFSLLGHMRGGPAKAAVLSSAMTGLISGSSIANVVTTGTFTIPLMKRMGFPAEKAGAVEVASSTNGQLMPPIMGAAAFLMVEYVGIPYVDVIRHAFLPAVISYIALIYIVHLEALKAGMRGLPRRRKPTLAQTLMTYAFAAVAVMGMALLFRYGYGPLKAVAPGAAAWIVGGIALAAYPALVWYAAGSPATVAGGVEADLTELPEPGPTLRSGLYFMLPVATLVWCLTEMRLSPGLSAFYATVAMMLVVVTHRPMLAAFRGERWEMAAQFRAGLADLMAGMVSGGRNMVGIGVATAAAGIVVGTVTQTGIGQVMTDFVEAVSGGNLVLILLLTALISLLLGMGLPTTANYIVVSTLMAPVVVTLGAAQGLAVPLIAVHMFVFYFGILADDTPPVGLAAYAAAAISRGDPIRTGVQGFTYDIRTAILPFMFIFNTELLMIGIANLWHFLLVVAAAVAAMMLFAAGTQGYFITRSRLWESLALILVAFTLFRPGFWMDMAVPPIQTLPASEISIAAVSVPAGGSLQTTMSGETLEGEFVTRIVTLELGPSGTAAERLSHAGIEIREEDRRVLVDSIVFGSPAERAGVDFDWEIVELRAESEQPMKYWFYIPALMLLAFVVAVQRRRRDSGAF